MIKADSRKSRFRIYFRLISGLICFFFTLTSITPPSGFAQVPIAFSGGVLPQVGTMVAPSPGFVPPMVRGIRIHPENPLRFDFIVDTGYDTLTNERLRDESSKLIKYFLASLTVPAQEMWVNLSPSEPDRIVPSNFGITEMGRDLLAQDYLLKQLTASLMYPEEELGEQFWNKIYTQAGTKDIPVDTFNKVWIVPDSARVYQSGDMAFVTESRLKVLLEEDYLTRDSALSEVSDQSPQTDTKQIVRDIIIPAIEQEVNEGENFAILRQIYNSMILATWFKRNVQRNILGEIYIEENKVSGVDIQDKQAKQKIYEQYLEAFKIGVYNYIKEDYDPLTQQIIPRKYFSGGVEFGEAMDAAMLVEQTNPFDLIDQAQLTRTGEYQTIAAELDPVIEQTDAAMITFGYPELSDLLDQKEIVIFETTNTYDNNAKIHIIYDGIHVYLAINGEVTGDIILLPDDQSDAQELTSWQISNFYPLGDEDKGDFREDKLGKNYANIVVAAIGLISAHYNIGLDNAGTFSENLAQAYKRFFKKVDESAASASGTKVWHIEEDLNPDAQYIREQLSQLGVQFIISNRLSYDLQIHRRTNLNGRPSDQERRASIQNMVQSELLIKETFDADAAILVAPAWPVLEYLSDLNDAFVFGNDEAKSVYDQFIRVLHAILEDDLALLFQTEEVTDDFADNVLSRVIQENLDLEKSPYIINPDLVPFAYYQIVLDVRELLGMETRDGEIPFNDLILSGKAVYFEVFKDEALELKMAAEENGNIFKDFRLVRDLEGNLFLEDSFTRFQQLLKPNQSLEVVYADWVLTVRASEEGFVRIQNKGRQSVWLKVNELKTADAAMISAQENLDDIALIFDSSKIEEILGESSFQELLEQNKSWKEIVNIALTKALADELEKNPFLLLEEALNSIDTQQSMNAALYEEINKDFKVIQKRILIEKISNILFEVNPNAKLSEIEDLLNYKSLAKNTRQGLQNFLTKRGIVFQKIKDNVRRKIIENAVKNNPFIKSPELAKIINASVPNMASLIKRLMGKDLMVLKDQVLSQKITEAIEENPEIVLEELREVLGYKESVETLRYYLNARGIYISRLRKRMEIARDAKNIENLLDQGVTAVDDIAKKLDRSPATIRKRIEQTPWLATHPLSRDLNMIKENRADLKRFLDNGKTTFQELVDWSGIHSQIVDFDMRNDPDLANHPNYIKPYSKRGNGPKVAGRAVGHEETIDVMDVGRNTPFDYAEMFDELELRLPKEHSAIIRLDMTSEMDDTEIARTLGIEESRVVELRQEAWEAWENYLRQVIDELGGVSADAAMINFLPEQVQQILWDIQKVLEEGGVVSQEISDLTPSLLKLQRAFANLKVDELENLPLRTKTIKIGLAKMDLRFDDITGLVRSFPKLNVHHSRSRMNGLVDTNDPSNFLFIATDMENIYFWSSQTGRWSGPFAIQEGQTFDHPTLLESDVVRDFIDQTILNAYASNEERKRLIAENASPYPFTETSRPNIRVGNVRIQLPEVKTHVWKFLTDVLDRVYGKKRFAAISEKNNPDNYLFFVATTSEIVVFNQYGRLASFENVEGSQDFLKDNIITGTFFQNLMNRSTQWSEKRIGSAEENADVLHGGVSIGRANFVFSQVEPTIIGFPGLTEEINERSDRLIKSVGWAPIATIQYDDFGKPYNVYRIAEYQYIIQGIGDIADSQQPVYVLHGNYFYMPHVALQLDGVASTSFQEDFGKPANNRSTKQYKVIETDKVIPVVLDGRVFYRPISFIVEEGSQWERNATTIISRLSPASVLSDADAATLTGSLDAAEIFNKDKYFLKAVNYFNSEVLKRDETGRVEDLTWEKVIDLYELFRGDRDNPEYTDEIRSERLEFYDIEGILARANKVQYTNRDDIIEDVVEFFAHVIETQIFAEGVPGFNTIRPMSDPDAMHPAQGHNRLAWFLINFLLIRNGYTPFYPKNAQELEQIGIAQRLIEVSPDRYKYQAAIGREELRELLELRVKLSDAAMHSRDRVEQLRISFPEEIVDSAADEESYMLEQEYTRVVDVVRSILTRNYSDFQIAVDSRRLFFNSQAAEFVRARFVFDMLKSILPPKQTVNLSTGEIQTIQLTAQQQDSRAFLYFLDAWQIYHEGGDFELGGDYRPEGFIEVNLPYRSRDRSYQTERKIINQEKISIVQSQRKSGRLVNRIDGFFNERNLKQKELFGNNRFGDNAMAAENFPQSMEFVIEVTNPKGIHTYPTGLITQVVTALPWSRNVKVLKKSLESDQWVQMSSMLEILAEMGSASQGAELTFRVEAENPKHGQDVARMRLSLEMLFERMTDYDGQQRDKFKPLQEIERDIKKITADDLRDRYGLDGDAAMAASDNFQSRRRGRAQENFIGYTPSDDKIIAAAQEIIDSEYLGEVTERMIAAKAGVHVTTLENRKIANENVRRIVNLARRTASDGKILEAIALLVAKGEILTSAAVAREAQMDEETVRVRRDKSLIVRNAFKENRTPTTNERIVSAIVWLVQNKQRISNNSVARKAGLRRETVIRRKNASRFLKDYFDKEKQRIELLLSSGDQAQITDRQEVGGIDLNSDKLDIDVQGELLEFDLPVNLQYLQTTPINGFVPVILDVLPTNLPLLLGIRDEDMPEPVAVGDSYQELSYLKED